MEGTPLNTLPAQTWSWPHSQGGLPEPKVVKTGVNGVRRWSDSRRHPPIWLKDLLRGVNSIALTITVHEPSPVYSYHGWFSCFQKDPLFRAYLSLLQLVLCGSPPGCRCVCWGGGLGVTYAFLWQGWMAGKLNSRPPPPLAHSYNGQTEKTYPFHIIWSKIITYSYNLYPNPYLSI